MEHGQAGVGEDGDVTVPVLGEVVDVLGHLDRPGGAVESEGEDGVGAKRGDRGADLRTQQHAARRLDGHADHDGDVVGPEAGLLEREQAGVHRALHLQEVLAGLDEERIDPPVDEAPGLFGVGVEHLVPRGLSEGDQLRPGSHRTEDEPGAVRGGVVVAGGARDAGRLPVQLPGEGDEFVAELGEDQLVGPEGVGLHRVGAGGEVLLVDLLDEFRPRADQEIHAVLVTQVVGLDVEIDILDRGSHRAVQKKDPACKLFNEATRHGKSVAIGLDTFNRSSGSMDGQPPFSRPRHTLRSVPCSPDTS